MNCGGSYTIPEGYHNGSGKVTANSLASQTSANATASDILVDKTAYVNGAKITGTMPNKGTSTNTLTLNGSLTLPKGYYDSIKVTQSVTTRGSTTDAISQGHKKHYQSLYEYNSTKKP